MLISAQPPNRLDRAISWVSPTWGARRARARLVEALAGSWNGASYSRRQTKSWVTQAADADADLIYDLNTLRQRSRDLIRNAPVATGALGTAQANVVGTGLKLQSRIDSEFLRLSDEQADIWQDTVEREWRLFSESCECDYSRILNFHDLQALAFRSTLENGDCFALLPRLKRPGSPYLLKIQLVEADRVCNRDRVPDKAGLVAGIEKDETTGAPLRYHVMNQHPECPYVAKGGYSWETVEAFGAKTGIRNVLHLYEQLRIGQTRGVPFLAPVVETLKMLDRYTEAELMAAVVSGLFTVFVKSESGELNFDTLSGMAAETGATSSDDDIKLGPGAVVGLKTGKDITTANPGRPNTAFDPFIKAILEQIGAALGIPFEVLIRHFNSSYSASRAALLEAWRFFRARRVWLVSSFCQPVYETFLWEAVASGRIPAPGFFASDLIRKAYCRAAWIGDSPGYVDPDKDVQAARDRIDGRLSTLDEETALLTGGDFETNLRQMAKEKRMLDKAGLAPAPPKPKPGQVPPPDGEGQPGEGEPNTPGGAP